MEEFSRIKTFIKVVEAGSFSAAARELTSLSSVARHVKSLEDELGVRLLHRNTRSLALTHAGARFYERVVSISRELENACVEVKSLQQDVKGLLRVSLRVAAGATVVVPALPEFLKRYPELTLEILLTDERQDLIASNIDVAVWLGAPPDTNLVARRLSRVRRVVCGTPAYFAEYGTPLVPQDLSGHNCLMFAAPSYGSRWSFVRDGFHEEIEVSGSIRSKNGLVLLSCALDDVGVMIAHEWMVRSPLAEGRLVSVLGAYTVSPRPADADLYAVFSSSRRMSRNVRVFVDFLVEAFKSEDAAP